MPDLHLTVSDAADTVGGTLVGNGSASLHKVLIDSRQDVSGALFVALRGERFDGHSFIQDVARQGALAALVEEPNESVPIPQIVVSDTLQALHRLAASRRKRFTGKVVGITGSSGKTTTRKLVSAILGQQYAVHQPVKNFNNHIGVPLTLLELADTHQVAVLELGCSDFGEIEILTKLSKPDIALVTNVGPAHLEKLIDLDGVARAKGELFRFTPQGGVSVVNLDDPRVSRMPVRTRQKVTYGKLDGADIRLRCRPRSGLKGQPLEYEIFGEKHSATLPLLGAHNAINALSAVSVAVATGLENDAIAAGLAQVVPEPGRLVLKKTEAGAWIIDDSYNANPASVRAALDVLVELSKKGKTIAVLGDMLELGEASDPAHYEIGKYVFDVSIDFLITMGPNTAWADRGASESGMPGARRMRGEDHHDVVRIIREAAGQNDVILVKGSRGMKMERVVSELMEVEDAF